MSCLVFSCWRKETAWAAPVVGSELPKKSNHKILAVSFFHFNIFSSSSILLLRQLLTGTESKVPTVTAKIMPANKKNAKAFFIECSKRESTLRSKTHLRRRRPLWCIAAKHPKKQHSNGNFNTVGIMRIDQWIWVNENVNNSWGSASSSGLRSARRLVVPINLRRATNWMREDIVAAKKMQKSKIWI